MVGGGLKMTSLCLEKRTLNELFEGQTDNLQFNVSYQQRYQIKRAVLYLDNVISWSLTIAQREFRNIFFSKCLDESYEDTQLSLENSIFHHKGTGKERLLDILRELDSKQWTHEQYERMMQKIHIYTRITERKFINQEFDLDAIKRISVWVNDAASNLRKDLKLHELGSLTPTQKVTLSFNLSQVAPMGNKSISYKPIINVA